jgi:hypothetical protein
VSSASQGFLLFAGLARLGRVESQRTAITTTHQAKAVASEHSHSWQQHPAVQRHRSTDPKSQTPVTELKVIGGNITDTWMGH